MELEDRELGLMLFLSQLPGAVQTALFDKNLDPLIELGHIGEKHDLNLGEIWWLREGVRRIFAGEESAAELLKFITPNLEEDNQPKAPYIGEDIQKSILDIALPILKANKFAIKEGRVPVPVQKPEVASSKLEEQAAAPARQSLGAGADTANSSALSASPMDERHLRALLRIAAGTTYTEEKLRQAFESLPEGLRRSITSVDTANVIQAVAKKYLLHVDQMSALASETGLVLLGLTHPRDIVKNLSSRLKISDTRALEIAKDISTDILSKVREGLRSLHETPRSAPQPSVPPEAKSTPAPRMTAGTAAPRKLDVLSAQEAPASEKSATSASNQPRTFATTPYTASWNTQVRPDAALVPSQASAAKPTGAATQKGPGLVGPTGWRPSINSIASEVSNLSKYPINKLEAPAQPKPQTAAPAPVKPSSAGLPPLTPKPASLAPTPATPKAVSGDMLSDKLSGPMGVRKEERTYTTDPYREPIG